MRSSTCGSSQEVDVGAEVDSFDGVRLGYEREVEDDDADKRARGVSQRKRRARRRAASAD
jgi:hypothetical protein